MTALGCWEKLSHIFACDDILVLMVLYLFSQRNLLSNLIYLEIRICTTASLGKLLPIGDEYNVP